MSLKPNYSNLIVVFSATIVQFYNYALFGLAANILAQNFIPATNDISKLLNFFLFFSLAVLVRPLGSLIFGTIGDYYGRTVSIKIALLFEIFSTGIIAGLPSFSTSGYLAPSLLILSRMLFMMSLSGKVDGIKVYVFEKAGRNNKYFANGIISASGQIGVLLAAILYAFTSSYEVNELWRLSFFIGSVSSVIVLYFSRHLVESTEFSSYQKLRRTDKVDKPVIDTDNIFKNAILFRKHIMVVTVISGCCGGIYHFLIIFLATFLAKIATLITSQSAHYLNIALISTYFIASLVSGFLADRYSSNSYLDSEYIVNHSGSPTTYPFKQILVALSIALIVTIIFIFFSSYTSNQYLIYAITGCLIFCTAMFTVPLQVINQGLFRVDTRMRFYSISHSVGSMIFSSTIPFCGTVIWYYTNSPAAVISLLTVLFMILLSAVLYLRQQDLSVTENNYATT